MSVRFRAALAVSLSCVALPLFAQGLGQTGIVDEVIVTAQRVDGSLTAIGPEAARAALSRIAGGIGLVESSVYLDNAITTLGDTLSFTPGVFADTAAVRENRISIRGSGLGSSFERRGLTLLRDGIPVTNAGGSTEFQEVDPLSVSYLEIYKGANGLRYGASSLGGAVNLVTPTGRTVEAAARCGSKPAVSAPHA